MVNWCGFTKVTNLSKKNNIAVVNSIPTSSIIIKGLPKNQYCSSITGKYAFNLLKISSFKVYFWKSTDSSTINNEAINKTLTKDNTAAIDWPDSYKSDVMNALNQYTTFLNKISTIESQYNNSDIVCQGNISKRKTNNLLPSSKVGETRRCIMGLLFCMILRGTVLVGRSVLYIIDLFISQKLA